MFPNELTSQYVNVDGGFDCVDGLANVGSRIFTGGFLNEEVAGGALTLLGDYTHAPSRRVEVDLLKQEKGIMSVSFLRLSRLGRELNLRSFGFYLLYFQKQCLPPSTRTFQFFWCSLR